MKTIIIVLIGLFIHKEASADWQAIISASHTTELIAAEKSLFSQQKYQSNCTLELKRGWFPLNCLFWMNYQLKKPLASMSLNVLFNRIDRSCQEKAHELDEARVVRELLSLELPARCREVLKIQRDDLAYIEDGPVFE